MRARRRRKNTMGQEEENQDEVSLEGSLKEHDKEFNFMRIYEDCGNFW